MKSDMTITLEKYGVTIPQILCGLLCRPAQTKELYYIYKALERTPDNKALESKALGLRLALGFAEQGELPL